MTNKNDVVQEGWDVVERLYDRLGTKSARGLDLDAAVVLTQCVEALENFPFYSCKSSHAP
jgi:hypothetical protein